MQNAKSFIRFLTGAAFVAAALFAQSAEAGGKNAYKPYYENAALRYDVTEPRKMDLQYDVYAGGFHALDASLELDLDKKAYDVGIDAKTKGFIGKMFPWQASYSTSGHAEKGVLIPTTSTGRSAWRNRVSTTEMKYDPKGRLVKTTTQSGSKTTVNRDIDKNMATNAVDILTSTLLIMQNARNTQKCEGSFPVFDGKRRFNITLHDDGTDTIQKSKYSSFSGEAMRCTMKMEPVAGFKDKDLKRGWMAVQAHTEERKKDPTIWLARLDSKGPVVPVRMEIASQYGTVVAHLTGTN
jgi:YD repeat-containing protein